MSNRESTPATKQDIFDLYDEIKPVKEEQGRHDERLQTLEREMGETRDDMKENAKLLPTLATKEDVANLSKAGNDKFWKGIAIALPLVMTVIVFVFTRVLS